MTDELTANALDGFAAAWLQHWTDAGGYVEIDSSGSAGFGFPEYSESPSYVEASPDLPEFVRSMNYTFSDGAHAGKMRALFNLLKAVPSGTDAVKAHMLSHGLIRV